MKIIILAAGMGRRLGNRTGPKPLTILCNNKSILEMQIDFLSAHYGRQNIVVVVGYKKEEILNKFPDLSYVENPAYEKENTSKSLLRALYFIEDEDVLWINGDVVFHPDILLKIDACKKSSTVVNKGPVGEEEVKYTCRPDGSLLKISKQISHAEGESLGINFFYLKDLPILIENLQKCKDSDYFEKAIQLSIDAGTEIRPIVVDKTECVEVDFPKDLNRANELLLLWNKGQVR